GVRLVEGRRIHARHAVLSRLDPQTTFFRFLPADVVPSGVRSQAEYWTWAKWSLLSVFFAVDRNLSLRAADVNLAGDAFSNVLGFDGFDDVVGFVEAIEQGRIDKFAGHFTCESAFDPTLSQIEGHHTCFFQMPAPYDFDWSGRRTDVVEEVTGLL